MDLKGHVAVVTGASRGVGEKIANALEARGMLVAHVWRLGSLLQARLHALTRERTSEKWAGTEWHIIDSVRVSMGKLQIQNFGLRTVVHKAAFYRQFG